MNCAVIGSTKIAEVHVNELIKNKVKEITILSRSKKKRNILVSILKSRYNENKIIFKSSNINILKKSFFDLIVICTKNNTHHYYLNLIKNSKSYIIVEKPIISLQNFDKYYENYLNKIYNKFNKILVCYPMHYFAQSIKRNLKSKKKLKYLEFIMKTGGRYTYKNIFINLMPHVLSFINNFQNLNDFPLELDKKNSIENKNYYKLTLNSKRLKIKAYIKEETKKKTKILVKCNNQILSRVTKNKILEFKNYLKINNKLISIENPMSQFYRDFFKNRRKTYFFNKNMILTYILMKEKYKLLKSL